MSTKAEILKLREAYFNGGIFGMFYKPSCDDVITRQAALQYPLPKIERPRVIERRDPHGSYIRFAIIDGRLKHGFYSTYPHWDTLETIAELSPATVQIAFDVHAELKAQPTELVEDDA